MKKLLIVSGDSWTDENFISSFHPEIDCSWPKWPEILAKKLDMDCINLGKCGAGNEYIYSSLLDILQKTNKEDVGLVIAAWSTAPRRCYSYKGRWTNDMIDEKGDLNYWIEKSIRYYKSFEILMDSLKLPYLHFQMISLYKSYVYYMYHKKYPSYISKPAHDTKIMALKNLLNTSYQFNDKFLGWPTDEDIGGFTIDQNIVESNNKISELDLHPNSVGQEQIAEFIYENI